MAKTLKVGIIGVGGIAGTHVPGWQASPHAEIVAGTGLAELGRFAEALRHYEKGGELARVLGNLRLTAYATLNRAAALLDLERYGEAGGALQAASGCFGILEERDTLALLKVYEGQREMGLGRWSRAERAWEEGISGLRKHGSPVDLVRCLKEVGGFHIREGKVESGRSYLLEARILARKLGNATLLSEITRDLSRPEVGSIPRHEA